MILFWRIRYLDRRDRHFYDRDLWLDTDSLPPKRRAEVEAIYEARELLPDAAVLKLLHLFKERSEVEADIHALVQRSGAFGGFSLPHYFEDENGHQIEEHKLGAVVRGEPNIITFPPGMRPHDIEFALARTAPPPIESLTIQEPDLRLFAYFDRDIKELSQSALMREGPGRLVSRGNAAPDLQTATTDEEIRSFVTIFRRLYMDKEPANFLESVDVFCRIVGDHPLAKWVRSEADLYSRSLQEAPDLVPLLVRGRDLPTRKRIIDVYLYTRYAHQPDARRTRQFADCLRAVDGKVSMLMWLFLVTVWETAWHMRNAGGSLQSLLAAYCRHHSIDPPALASVSQDSPRIGTLESKDARIHRIVEEKSQALARDLWEERGCPPEGPEQFLPEAQSVVWAMLG